MWIILIINLIITDICYGFCWTSNCQSTTQDPTGSPIITISPTAELRITEIPSNAPSPMKLESSVSPSGQIITEEAMQEDLEPVEFQSKYTTGPYKFALIPKATTNPFFDPARIGCMEKAKSIGDVECIYDGPATDDAKAQSDLIYKYVDTKAVQGIAVSVSDASAINGAINYAIKAGVPVVTFDSDAPQSNRLSYIGTNNFALGQHLAKVLLQIDPTGYEFGKYGFVSANGPNLAERIEGFRNRMGSYEAYEMRWEEVSYSPTNCNDDTDIALQQMYQYADDPQIRAIIPVGGWPMWNKTEWTKFVNTYRKREDILILVVADSLPDQIELINKGYVNGLVGQTPYQMGEVSMQTLYDINEGKGASQTSQIVYGTNLLQVLRVPLILPPIDINQNYIGNLRFMGYISFAIIAILAIGFTIMSIVKRNTRVIRASQPFFLVMICIGTLIMGSTIITASIDTEFFSDRGCDIACMATPWLLCIGFSTTFSALFSKTWRINQLIRNASRFKRVKVTIKDVILPFVIIMVSNLIVLITWTIVSPLKFERYPDPGTDPWNRVIKTYGYCKSPYSAVFGSILFAIAIILLMIANVQAYQARRIRTEFSESKYIAVAVAAIFQALIVGAPVIVLSRTQPRTSFVVFCLLIFVTCTAVLFLILAPKAKALLSPPPPPPPKHITGNRWTNQSTLASKNDNRTSTGENGLKINTIKSIHIKIKSSLHSHE